MPSKSQAIAITEKALVQRLNRALAKSETILRKSRPGTRMEIDYGNYYSVSFRNNINGAHIDIEDLGRELGVMRPHETLAEPN